MNINKLIYAGRLTRDPELRYTGTGTAVCELSIASNRKWRTKEGEEKEDVTFIDATVWGKHAESCEKYLKKASPVLLEGRLKMQAYTDAKGTERKQLKVEAEQIQFLDKSGKREEAE